MNFTYLSKSVSIKTVEETSKNGVFEVEGLFAGYGLTIGNALRRALLSSLPGAAVTQVKIKNVSHEFSTLPGVKEDMVELSLNFKKIRFRTSTDDPQTLSLKVKGEKIVTADDIKVNADIEITNPHEVLAHLTSKSAELDIEITVQRGLGYSAVESRKDEEKLAIGTIAIDAFFSPVTKVSYSIDNMRVGDRTDYNRLRLEIETDGTLSPSAALHKSGNILLDHFKTISDISVQEFDRIESSKETKKSTKKTTKKSKAE
ncbi:MAG: DNA-directed RNA polymerase subunit alpha [Parcubacteria group bacterium Gr01-1014_20]|nr:MAG: DNA-directed RNA polymerase subunit alpha [Parcubacteria group bacterium Gr01-1014_20]